jgi:DNA-directed RNA polymerase subunit RPC12/RpoP
MNKCLICSKEITIPMQSNQYVCIDCKNSIMYNFTIKENEKVLINNSTEGR